MADSLTELQNEVKRLTAAIAANPGAAEELSPKLTSAIRSIQEMQLDPVLVGGGTSEGGQACVQHCIRHQVCNSHPAPPAGPILTADQGGQS